LPSPQHDEVPPPDARSSRRRFFARLHPQEEVTPREIERGVRAIVVDGVTTQIMATLVGGTFLAAFALRAGASNAVIGLLAAIGPATQLLQLPLISLITRWRRRKAPVVWSVLAGRLVWLGIAAIPFLLPARARVPALVAGIVLTSVCGTVAGTAWNPWLRDVLPEHLLGPALARRMAFGTAASALVGLGAGLAVEHWKGAVPEPLALYAAVFLVGTLVGLAGVGSITRIPEPVMPHAPPRPLRDILGLPFRDRRYRNVMRFLAAWNVAVNVVAPFFVVYMLRRLGFGLGLVVALQLGAQLVNAMVLQQWGRLGERFSTSGVLAASGLVWLCTLLLWPLAGMPQLRELALPLIVLAHLVGGLANAGVTYGTGTLALQRAPKGIEATAYLATNAVVSGAAAALAPVVAGTLTDWLDHQHLVVTISWLPIGDPGAAAHLVPVDLRGLDFLFLLAFVLGLYALYRLSAVRRRGEEVRRTVVLAAFSVEVRRTMRDLSTIESVRQVANFPFSALAVLFPERRGRGRGRTGM
jgi:MFS family permease